MKVVILLLFTGFIGVSFFTGLALGTVVAEVPPTEQVQSTVAEVVPFNDVKLADLINQERAKAGVHPLTTSAELIASACAKADEMMTKQYWSHYSPEGEAPWAHIERAGYYYQTVGENLLFTGGSEESGIQSWMESEGHRNNLLSAEFNEQGMCSRTGDFLGNNSNVVVNHFGRR